MTRMQLEENCHAQCCRKMLSGMMLLHKGLLQPMSALQAKNGYQERLKSYADHWGKKKALLPLRSQNTNVRQQELNNLFSGGSEISDQECVAGYRALYRGTWELLCQEKRSQHCEIFSGAWNHESIQVPTSYCSAHRVPMATEEIVQQSRWA